MSRYEIPFWKKNPFIRLLLPIISGILYQWYCTPAPRHICLFISISLVVIIVFFFVPLFNRYRLSTLNGVAVSLLFFSCGLSLTFNQDIRERKDWFGHYLKKGDRLIVKLEESLVEKTKSFKADAVVTAVIENNRPIPASGGIVLYFKKDSSMLRLSQGDQLMVLKNPTPILSSGNPAGFNYQRYSLFRGYTHQLYLEGGEFVVLPLRKISRLDKLLLTIRQWVLGVLRSNIKGEKESGLAEALLIGYKYDLDKNLTNSYTNTGVVHIIAISGMHLGLVYLLLLLLLKPFEKNKRTRWLRPILILVALWLFTLLAGAQASVVRSAVMFTCIVAGEALSRKTSIYNTLALSAFVLLVYNPFWLWDVGFQLSYTAVLSIIIFSRPLYTAIYIKNKLIDKIWQLNAVTISAQILTLPLCLYHFHQFPNYFLFTNFIAIPISSIVLFGEILLCCICFIPALANFIGQVLEWLISWMNHYIENVEAMPFSVWRSLEISLFQTILLTIALSLLSHSFIEKSKSFFKIGLIALFIFVFCRALSFINADRQQKVIVYNIPRQSAIDFLEGRNYFFAGDTTLESDEFAQRFHLQPSRQLYRALYNNHPANLIISGSYVQFHTKHILISENSISYSTSLQRLPLDLLVLSRKSVVAITQLAETFYIKQVVIDASVPSWKAEKWENDCAKLNIACHDVATKGAFVMNLR